jgi:hypothetical protein
MTARALASIVAIASCLTACGARGEPSPGSPHPDDAGTTAAVSTSVTPPDSLALSIPDGTMIWFAEGRRAADSAGATCVERTLEIRRDTVRMKVPLFYTRAAPTVLDDTSLRAELYRDCEPVGVYRVNLRTGAPTPLLPTSR